jgi:imidazolonepropionase
VPAAAPLADAVDAFCETIAFSVKQTAKVFAKAKELGLPVKLHADQLSDSGGAQLAAQCGALSADHLEYTSEAGATRSAGKGPSRSCCRSVLFSPREAAAAARRAAPAPRADRDRDRPQPGLFAARRRRCSR